MCLVNLSGGGIPVRRIFYIANSDVIACVLSRYKYLQKPLETITLPGLLQYIHRWLPVQKEKLAMAIAVMISQNIVSTSCLAGLMKDHLTKDGPSRCLHTTVSSSALIMNSLDAVPQTLQ